jgi:hypothetical protein
MLAPESHPSFLTPAFAAEMTLRGPLQMFAQLAGQTVPWIQKRYVLADGSSLG